MFESTEWQRRQKHHHAIRFCFVLGKSGIEMWWLLQNRYKDELVLLRPTGLRLVCKIERGTTISWVFTACWSPLFVFYCSKHEYDCSDRESKQTFVFIFYQINFFPFFSYVKFLVIGMLTNYMRHAYNYHGNEVATWFLYCRHRNNCTKRWQCRLSCSA